MRASAPRAHAGAVAKRLFVVPRVATLLLVGIALAGVMADATVRTWSVIFMRDSFTVPGWVEALSLPAFLLMLSTGRLFGDALVERFGPVRLAAALLCVAMLGLGLVLTARDLFQAMVGFGFLGIGICVIYPLTISAAARIGGRPASENVTSVTMVMSLIMLGVPALMGFAAQQFGIRASFAILLPVLLLALLLVHRLDPKPAV